MKIAFQVEGPLDLVVLSILTGRILGTEIEVCKRERRPGGVAAVRATLVPVSWQFWKEGAQGIVVVTDNDDQVPVHEVPHEGHAAEFGKQGCRYCDLVASLPTLPARPPLPPFKFAVGVAVQALEAWLLFGADLVGKKREAQPERLPTGRLKQMLYATPEPRVAVCLKISTPTAKRLDLDALALACPSFRFFQDSVLQLKDC